MPTGIVQFREDATELHYLRQKGINPNELAREAFDEALRKIRAQDRYQALKSLRLRLKGDPVDLVRRERESH